MSIDGNLKSARSYLCMMEMAFPLIKHYSVYSYDPPKAVKEINDILDRLAAVTLCINNAYRDCVKIGDMIKVRGKGSQYLRVTDKVNNYYIANRHLWVNREDVIDVKHITN